MRGLAMRVWMMWVVLALVTLLPALVQAQRMTLQSLGPSGGDWRFLARTSNGVLLAATSERIFRSTDHGQTWSSVSIPMARTPIKLLRATPDGVLVDFNGLKMTEDGGLSWRTCHSAVSTSIDIAHDGVQTLYVSNGSGIWASTDGCRTFTQRRVSFGMRQLVATATEVLWANQNNVGQLLRSTDGGVTASTTATFASIDALHVTPSGAVLVASGANVYRRATPQSSFVLQQALAGAVQRFVSNGSRVLALGTVGIAQSGNDGQTFTAWTPPGGALLSFDGEFAADASTVLIGTTATLWRAPSLGAALTAADTGLFAKSIRGVSTSFGVTYAHTAKEMLRSSDAGQTWVRANEGLPIGLDAAGLSQDWLGNTFLVGSGALYWRAPNAAAWTLSRSSGAETGAIAASRDQGTIYFGNWSNVFRSTDRGVSATASSGIGPAVRLQAGPTGVVYAATYSTVWRSGDGGFGFTPVTVGLPNFINVGSMVVDAITGTGWVMDDSFYGLFASERQSAVWGGALVPDFQTLGSQPRVLWAGRDRVLIASENGMWMGRGATPLSLRYEKLPAWPSQCANSLTRATSAAELVPGQWLVGTNACSTFLLTDTLIFADGLD